MATSTEKEMTIVSLRTSRAGLELGYRHRAGISLAVCRRNCANIGGRPGIKGGRVRLPVSSKLWVEQIGRIESQELVESLQFIRWYARLHQSGGSLGHEEELVESPVCNRLTGSLPQDIGDVRIDAGVGQDLQNRRRNESAA